MSTEQCSSCKGEAGHNDSSCVACATYNMQAKVNEMPLSTWLYAINKSIPHIGKDHAMREFVSGLHERGLLYHFDDHAVECLEHRGVSVEENILIDQIVGELYCEDMFTLAIQLTEGTTCEEYLQEHLDERSKGFGGRCSECKLNDCECDLDEDSSDSDWYANMIQDSIKMSKDDKNLLNEAVDLAIIKALDEAIVSSKETHRTPILTDEFMSAVFDGGQPVDGHNCFCNIKDLATWGCKCGGK